MDEAPPRPDPGVGDVSNAPIFEAVGLTKYYGPTCGVEAISLQIRRGEIFGLLGPNGAGKTTLIRSALGLLRPSSGSVRLFGDRVELNSDRHHEALGYLPADLRLWPRLKASRISDLFLRLDPSRASGARRHQLSERLGLDLQRQVKSLSLGNRQKVGLILALQHDPLLVILDEPTSGLDPLVRRTVMSLLRERAAAGATIVYSSHNLNEVEEICSRVAILRQGRLAALKTIAELRSEHERRLQITFRAETAMPQSLPDSLHGHRLIETKNRCWEVAFTGSPDPLIRWLASFDLDEIASPPMSLEESFMKYYREDRL